MAQATAIYLSFSDSELRLIEEAVDRVMSELKHPYIDRVLVRRAVVDEMRHGAPVMFRLVKAGSRACDAAGEPQSPAASIPRARTAQAGHR